jgi:uncharacterized protein (TIGR02452 family)
MGSDLLRVVGRRKANEASAQRGRAERQSGETAIPSVGGGVNSALGKAGMLVPVGLGGVLAYAAYRYRYHGPRVVLYSPQKQEGTSTSYLKPSVVLVENYGLKLKPHYHEDDETTRQRKSILSETLKLFEEVGTLDDKGKFGGLFHDVARENLTRWALNATTKVAPGTCVVEVYGDDWGVATQKLTKEYGVCFASLNMANAYTPGGGYTEGMIAQEENMFRRTDCHFAIVRETMMKPNTETYTNEYTDLLNGAHGRVYLDKENPRVCIRGPEVPAEKDKKLGYPLLDEGDIFPFYELRAAAVDLRRYDGNGKLTTPKPYDDAEMKRRVIAQLDTLKAHHVRHVVLSAFGCGAFMNPAAQVAKLYRDALETRRGDFDVVAFAVFYAGYGSRTNVQSFESAFDNWDPVARVSA